VGAFAPQLIFIDIYLSDISGFDLAKKIKTSYPEILIAVFSSIDTPEYRAAAAACGVEYLIPKDDWSPKMIGAVKRFWDLLRRRWQILKMPRILPPRV
jgi:DNA-binding NarL/FixJ family response regulator